jgi:WD40 repeat protein
VRGVFTPDGQQVVTTDYKANLRLVSARDGTLIRTLPRSHRWVLALTMGADGTVTAAGDNGTVLRFALRDNKVLADFRAGSRSIYNVAVTPDGGRILTAVEQPDGRQELRLWDANNGRAVQSLLGGSGPIRGVSVHPLSGELLIGGANARAWSLTGTPEKWTLRGGKEARVSFAGSDDVIFAPDISGAAALLKLQAGTPPTLWKPAGGFHRLLSLSADNRLAAISQQYTTSPILLLRNPGSAMEQIAALQLKSRLKTSVQRLRLSPTGHRLAVVEVIGGCALFDTATGEESVQLELKDVKNSWDLAWLSDERLLGLVTAKARRGAPGSEDRIVVWDVTTGKMLQTVTNRTAMDVLALAPDGKRFAEAGADKKVRIRDAATLAVQQELRTHDGPITALAWHPSKPILATASADLSVRVWNLDTGRRLEEIRGPLSPHNALSFSPGGRRLACSAGDVTSIWEPQSLQDPPAAK